MQQKSKRHKGYKYEKSKKSKYTAKRMSKTARRIFLNLQRADLKWRYDD